MVLDDPLAEARATGRLNECPPDHATLTAFKKRLLENGKSMTYEKLRSEVIAIALQKGDPIGLHPGDRQRAHGS